MKYFIDQKKYRIKYNERYIRIVGWCFHEDGSDVEFAIELNGAKKEHKIRYIKRPDVKNEYKKLSVNEKCGFNIKVYIDKNESPELVELFVMDKGIKTKILSLNKKQLDKIIDDKSISYDIDAIFIDNTKILVAGWASSVVNGKKVKLRVKQNGETQKIKRTSVRRIDLYKADAVKKNDMDCGFNVEFIYDLEKTYVFEIEDDIKSYSVEIEPKKIKRAQKRRNRRIFMKKFIKIINLGSIKKLFNYISKHGLKGLKTFIIQYVSVGGKLYSEWFEEQTLSQEELMEQSKVKFPYMPKISIIVPTYNTPDNFLREMIESVQAQTYSNWELCIGDGSGGNEALEKTVKEYAGKDQRLKCDFLKENLGISGNTNAALALATGDVISLLDHDDLLAPNALYEIVKTMNEDEEIDVVYTDEDKIDMDSKIHFHPHFKPDFSIDFLRSNNYICHFFSVKKEIVDKAGKFRSEYDGSQDYDFIFRCTEVARKVKRIPKILYYWRMHANSVAEDPTSKMYCYEAGKRAIESNLERSGIKGNVTILPNIFGYYDVEYIMSGEPLVSIIIPNKDEVDTLKTCLDSIYNKSTYSNYEIIVIENNSETKEILDYYKTIDGKNNTKVIYWEGEYNFSAINNYGIANSSGEFIVLLNNDTEIITPDWLEHMIGTCQRKDVGIVGAKLYYPDDTIQHAGIIIGAGGIAGNVFTDVKRDVLGYSGRAIVKQNLSGVTAACLMVKKSVFDEVGGLEEELQVAFNDVDFCLKVRAADYLIVFDPRVELYHYESKSRGIENTSDKMERFESEIDFMKSKWGEIIKSGDPYYSPNLSLIPRLEYNIISDSEKQANEEILDVRIEN